MKSCIFWDITPCRPMKVNLHCGGTYHIHLQGQRVSQARALHETEERLLVLGLFFNPEDGDMFAPKDS
jgi:hypothetical protein